MYPEYERECSPNDQTFKSISDNVVISLAVGTLVGRAIKLYRVTSE